MATAILRGIEEEITCPICLEFLTEPVSLDCGHSFCQDCITVDSQAKKNSCPVCRITYESENMRPNRHLTNVVERLKSFLLNPEEGEKKELCAPHGEKLLLFCKEDWTFICWLCERSQEHRGHHTFLIEEAAKECQEKLQACLERLRMMQSESELYETALIKDRSSWQNLIQNEIQSIQRTFKQMRNIMDSEEHKELQKLKKEKKNILHDLGESRKEVVQQSECIRDLIWELEHRLQLSPREMLNNVNDIIKRSETFTLTKPKTFPVGDRKVFQAPDLRAMLQAFNELREVQRYWVQMTLRVPDNNPDISISSGGREARRVLNQNAPLSVAIRDYCVLGSEAIKSGKCYWEVDVSDKREWIVGIRQIIKPTEHLQFKKKDDFNHFLFTTFQYAPIQKDFPMKYEPRFGYWVIALQNHSEYKAFVNSSVAYSGVFSLSVSVPPCRIGVFVDYEAGTVSFYNVTNHGFLIYAFTSCYFTHEIFPYFNLMNCSAPITLCSPTS